jgi:hypothetical protein
MIETDDGQPGVAPASFTRGAILASVLVVAIPAIISVSTLAMDHPGSEPAAGVTERLLEMGDIVRS